MAALNDIARTQPGWLLNRRFDTTFVHGLALLAIGSGAVVLIWPDLFLWVLMADLWLLGYHHVVSTFTRLAFDRTSLREYWFFVFVLPVIIFGATFAVGWGIGVWAIATIYLYWQWFHYTRQSWGISKVYAAKSGGRVADHPLFSAMCFYLVPIWGILHRSWQDPAIFLFAEIRVVPVPGLLVKAAGLAALTSLVIWGYTRYRLWRKNRLPVAHTLYMISHFAVFLVGYVAIDDITTGWLVINVWHNAQYIAFVWLYNRNRFKSGVEPKAVFLSELSQPRNILRYLLFCVAISTIVYLLVRHLTMGNYIVGLPLALLIYQAINFHHYVVDSFIWKVRKPKMQATLGLAEARA